MALPSFEEERIKTITNNNGTAIKFSDGTMICTKKHSFSNVNINTSWGNAYISSTLVLGDYAESFIESPVVNVTPVSSSSFLVIPSGNKGSASACHNVQLMRPSSGTGFSGTIDVIAIGRWK